MSEDLPWRIETVSEVRQLTLPESRPRPVFGVDRLPREEAESAPAWPSLAQVAREREAKYRAELKRR